jgi:malonyl-CoA/methylmalonyl-CoA synthetase
MAGSSVEFLFPFNADAAWTRFAAPFTGEQQKITCFTAVPTIYSRLMSIWDDLPPKIKENSRQAISKSNLRLNMAGSAALPTPLKNAWTEASDGNVLLERYGMTEVGMALSCGLAMEDRVDGSVGWPLPGVEVRLVDTETNEVIAVGEEVTDGREREGEIQLRGPTVFSEYWQNAEATKSEFVEDPAGKWFKTGDVAIRRLVDGAGQSEQQWAKGHMYFIKGRQSVDILKSGGEKISALEIEREMLGL